MKRVIIFLTSMIVFVSAAFAASNDQLMLTATVSTVYPVFLIYGGKTSAATADIAGTQAGASITFTEQEKNLAEDDIVVYIRLYQSNKSKYKGIANLTITASPLTNTDTTITGEGVVVATSAPTAAHITAEEVNGITYANNAAPAASSSNGNTVVTFAPGYDGRSIQATNIGTFDLTWGHNDNLAAGTYEATITLTYTPV